MVSSMHRLLLRERRNNRSNSDFQTFFEEFRSNRDTSNVIMKMKNFHLQVSKSVKFLGIIFDNNHDFNNHRLYICNKMSIFFGILSKLRQVLPKKHLLMLYNSLILPYIHYCNNTWASVGTTILDPIYKLQKKALRICTS